MIEFIVFGFCVVGAGYQAFNIGIREGAERALARLRDDKIITFDRNGHIRPNPFYLPKEEADN